MCSLADVFPLFRLSGADDGKEDNWLFKGDAHTLQTFFLLAHYGASGLAITVPEIMRLLPESQF